MPILLLILMGATVLVLVTGVIVMAKGGAINKKYSNQLMMLRVTVQGLAILLLFVMFYMYKK